MLLNVGIIGRSLDNNGTNIRQFRIIQRRVNSNVCLWILLFFFVYAGFIPTDVDLKTGVRGERKKLCWKKMSLNLSLGVTVIKTVSMYLNKLSFKYTCTWLFWLKSIGGISHVYASLLSKPFEYTCTWLLCVVIHTVREYSFCCYYMCARLLSISFKYMCTWLLV